jgi:diguanylate cyclase (GGDEF)-like protein
VPEWQIPGGRAAGRPTLPRKMTAQLPPSAPDSALINPRVLTGTTAAIVATLLLLLYFYRRRPFILYWIAGWILLASSMFLRARAFGDLPIKRMMFGISQFVALVGSLAFVVAADAYRHRPRWVRAYGLSLMPVAIWFSLAPAALPLWSVFAPGHVLIAGALTAAAIAYLMLLRDVRLLGALIVGVTLVVLAGMNLYIAAALPGPNVPGTSGSFFTMSVVFLVTALGMQLMTFEDMTYELQRTNHRLEAAQGNLRELVITDPLTGCRNRRFFDEIIGRELQRHRRYGTPMSIVFIDIDRFKAINDTLGHETGDRVLRDAASFLLRHIREADYVFRWGGDEFLVLITCTETEALKRATELQTAFAASPELEELPAGVALSVGAVEVGSDVQDVLPLIQAADERMYANKKRRR